MKCWSCGRTIPDEAKSCMHCEAPVEPPPGPEELELARNLLDQLPPEALRELREAFEKSATGEEFVNRIMVGDCPRCNSSRTSDCDADPEINNILLGRCLQCGLVWCLDCEREMQPGQTECPDCMAEEDFEDDEDYDEDYEYDDDDDDYLYDDDEDEGEEDQ